MNQTKNNRLILFIFSGLIMANIMMGQTIPADTSFNIRSEYKKQVKYYPNIKIATVGDTSGLRILRNVEYLKIDKRALHLDIIRPQQKQQKRRLPVIIFIHGGGWRSGNKTMEHPLAFEMARRGYACVCVEYRLSTEATYPAAVVDVITAVRWVRAHAKQYGFHPSQIVLEGTSSGGQLAALIGSINGSKKIYDVPGYAHISEKVQGVINIDGVLAFIHPESGEGKDKPGKPSAATLWFNSTVDENPAVRYEASALTYVNKKSAPVLFINSSIPRFHSGRDDMIKEMNRYGIAARVYEHEHCMHTFWLFHPWFNQTADWMDHFLKDQLKFKP